MSDPNDIYAYFTIADPDLDPAAITQEVGVVPTDSWRRGELNPRNGRERKFGRWSLYSRLPRSEEFEAHAADVIAQLNANPDAFKKISEQFGGCLELVGYFHSYYPGLHFNSEFIQELARYSLSVDCDFYYLLSHAREDSDP